MNRPKALIRDMVITFPCASIKEQYAFSVVEYCVYTTMMAAHASIMTTSSSWIARSIPARSDRRVPVSSNSSLSCRMTRLKTVEATLALFLAFTSVPKEQKRNK